MASAKVFFIYTCALLPLLAAWKERQCVFPFIFEGISYDSCTREGSKDGRLWCATTSNYDSNPQWKWCATQEPRPCHIPFIYKGKLYYSCTRDGAIDGQLWCATTPSYDKEKKWRTCITQEYGGNSDKKVCVIPFTYKGKTYYNCTNVDEPSGRLWCATTSSFDKNGEWTFCADPASPEEGLHHNRTCVFPFKYKGTTYSHCTKDGSIWGRLWCSLTSDYNVGRQWKFCDSSDIERGCSQQS